jgi:hypothetical protein
VAAPRFRLAGGRTFTLGEALLVTAASAAVPGIAHRRAGRRRTGAALLAGYAAVLLLTAVLPTGLPHALPPPDRPAATTAVSVAMAVAWATLILSSYLAVRPPPMRPTGRAAAGTMVAVLCALAAAPPLLLARHAHPYSVVVSDALARHPPGRPPAVPPAVPGTRPSQGSGARRLNILLVRGDAAGRRPGHRIGGMTLASVDTRTGETVLLSLPGDLRHLPIPGLPRGEPLNSVYDYGLAHPRLVGDRIRNPGAELLKRAFGRAVGMPVDYYRVVGARGFRQLTHSQHGPRACSAGPILDSGGSVRAGTLGRGSTPATDLPRRLPPPLVALSAKARKARVSSARLIPPRINTRRPDYRYLRAAAARAVGITGAPGRPGVHSRASRVLRGTCR